MTAPGVRPETAKCHFLNKYSQEDSGLVASADIRRANVSLVQKKIQGEA